jgi:hypothetical protein
MKSYKCTDTHPTVKKLQQLEDLANELGITICFSNAGTTLTDNDIPDTTFHLRDIEDEGRSWHPVGVMKFPPATEYKITLDK